MGKRGAGPRGTVLQRISTALNRTEWKDPLFRATKNLVAGGGGGGGREMDGDREWKIGDGKETTGVPLIGTHMSRDLISRYLRPYLAPCFIQ